MLALGLCLTCLGMYLLAFTCLSHDNNQFMKLVSGFTLVILGILCLIFGVF